MARKQLNGVSKTEEVDVSQWRVNSEGKMFRRGKYNFPNGDFYDGEWIDGKRNGKGLYQYVNGDKYVGEFKDGRWHGFGILTLAPRQINGETIIGRRYEGYWKHGKKHGRGLFIIGNGNSYDGEFKFDKFHGQGTMRYLFFIFFKNFPCKYLV